MHKAIEFYSGMVPGLEEHIEVAELITPYDFEGRLLYPQGAIYDLELDLSQ